MSPEVKFWLTVFAGYLALQLLPLIFVLSELGYPAQRIYFWSFVCVAYFEMCRLYYWKHRKTWHTQP